MPALTVVREALEEALGIRFEGEKGEHFFRSTLVQTLFYGIFSAWVLWSRDHAPDDRAARFDWKGSAWTLQVPVIRALFEQVATPGKLEPLRLVEVLDWAAAALNRVDRAAFFSRFEETHAVQYFYEPFLEAFDPELRKELGVWYTPPEVVQYMVARVDTVLREELDIADGLADPRVYVLDPCCGTGTYLLEVLERIALTLDERGGDALNTDDLKRAAMTRVFGFEIMPAPFVIAHLQLGLFLQHAGAPFSEHAGERAALLTGSCALRVSASTISRFTYLCGSNPRQIPPIAAVILRATPSTVSPAASTFSLGRHDTRPSRATDKVACPEASKIGAPTPITPQTYSSRLREYPSLRTRANSSCKPFRSRTASWV